MSRRLGIRCYYLGGIIFLVTLACLGRKDAYRDISHVILIEAHTISNKRVIKVSAQKNGEKHYDSNKYVFKFR